jgi:hypothetical protein
MAKTQKQRSAEFRARRDPELRGVYLPKEWHDWAKLLLDRYVRANKYSEITLTIATKRAKRKA